MKMKPLLTTIALTIISVLNVHAETPNEGAAAIRDLIAEKKYDVLFPTRYSEWYKVEKEGREKSEAIAQLSKMFEKRHKAMLDIYTQLSAGEFTISESDTLQVSETGKVATAMVKLGSREVPFKLYQMKNEKWGFHL